LFPIGPWVQQQLGPTITSLVLNPRYHGMPRPVNLGFLTGLTKLRQLEVSAFHVVLPPGLSGVTSLTRLVIKRNFIKQWPQVVSTMTQLRHLSFIDGGLMAQRPAGYFDALSALTHLQIWQCGKQPLQDLDLPNLQELDFSACSGVAEVPAQGLPRLQRLVASQRAGQPPQQFDWPAAAGTGVLQHP
jgi:hypothetical protein